MPNATSEIAPTVVYAEDVPNATTEVASTVVTHAEDVSVDLSEIALTVVYTQSVPNAITKNVPAGEY